MTVPAAQFPNGPEVLWITRSGLSCSIVSTTDKSSVVTVRDFAFPVGFDQFLTPNYG